VVAGNARSKESAERIKAKVGALLTTGNKGS
jgi:hypothetical protein